MAVEPQSAKPSPSQAKPKPNPAKPGKRKSRKKARFSLDLLRRFEPFQ
jgi:hypothetical protein